MNLETSIETVLDTLSRTSRKNIHHGDTARGKAMLFVSRAFLPCRRVAVVKHLNSSHEM
jgi:hypothetical protein